MGREAPQLSVEILGELSSYSFPGNVRELKNIIEHALIESEGGEILPHHLHFFKEARLPTRRQRLQHRAPIRPTYR